MELQPWVKLQPEGNVLFRINNVRFKIPFFIMLDLVLPPFIDLVNGFKIIN